MAATHSRWAGRANYKNWIRWVSLKRAKTVGRERAFEFADGSHDEVGKVECLQPCKRLVEDKHSSYDGVDGLLNRAGRKVDGGTHGYSFGLA